MAAFFKPWQTKWNLKKGWARPDDPGRARVAASPITEYEARRKVAKGEEVRKDTRVRAIATTKKAIADGNAKDRAGVLKALKANGFEVVRATNKSITIKNQEWKGDPKDSRAKVRLKNQVFYADWTLTNQLNPPAIDAAEEVAQLESKITKMAEKRRAYNLERYCQLEPEPEIIAPQDYDEPAEFIQAVLGERAIVSPKASARVKKRRDELQAFKSQIDLVDYAITQGFVKDERGSSTKSVKLRSENGSKIIIKPSTKEADLYFSPDNSFKSGTVIDFVQHYHQVNLGEARRILREYLGQQRQRKSARAIFGRGLAKLKSSAQKKKKKASAKVFVPKNYNNLVRHQYLERERRLSFSLFKSDRFSGQILIDERNNAVFPYRGKKSITGYERRNANFKGFGTGGKKTLWQSNQKSSDTQLVIVESPVDALSYHQLNPSQDTRYIATGGTVSPLQKQLIQAQIKQLSDKRGMIIIATDNDGAGDKLADEIRELLPSRNYIFQKRYRAKFKDWNEDLIAKYRQINHENKAIKRQIRKSNDFER